MSYDPIEAGRMEIALLASGEWVVSFDGKEYARTTYPNQVRRECARLFLANTVRRNINGKPLNQYKVRNLPRSVEYRLARALQAHMDELEQHARYRDDVEQLVHQPSSLQRHWRVAGSGR